MQGVCMPQTQQDVASTESLPSEISSEAGSLDPDYVDIVRGVKAGEPAAIMRLYAMMQRGSRWYLTKQLGPADAEDRLHDAFLALLHAIQAGDVRDARCLPGFVRVVVRRQVAAVIQARVTDRHRMVTDDGPTPLQVADADTPDPEEQLYRTEQVAMMRRTLAELVPQDREILERFYLHEQRPEQICEEMNLTACQFRNLKSRAKARFAELVEHGRRPRKALRTMAQVA
jgi:RNA polymerase sigma factor (sigma-70 family)